MPFTSDLPAANPSTLSPRDKGEVLIRCEGVSKKFCRSLKKSLWYGMQDIARELNPFSRHQHHECDELQLRNDEFLALNDVSFELRRGECLGLIGRNGAGKTTLLKMLNGLIKPDAGRIELRGRVGALIALGAGFNPILSGRENVYVNGAVLGLAKREIDNAMESIIDFSGIREFIDAPVQSYSSGMQVRLGFAVATTMEPDLLLVDEVLAVGDIDFRTKCYDRMEKIREKTAIILVSHNRQDINRICTRALFLKSGCVHCSGTVSDATNEYERGNAASTAFVRSYEGLNLLYAKIDKTEIICGEDLVIHIAVHAAQDLTDVYFRMSVMDYTEFGHAEWRSEHHGHVLELKRGENHFKFVVQSVRLKSGSYFCNFIFSKPFVGQYLLLAFRHQYLTVKGETNGLCTYQL